MTCMSNMVKYYLQVTIRIFLFVLVSSPLRAQTDSVRYDKWVGWVSPSTMFHFYHPAVEVGAEYHPGKNVAYILNYGWDVAIKKYIPYHGQHHQYLRVGIKKYRRKKLTSGYLMGDVGLFHLLHYDKYHAPESPPVYARFHEFLLKPRVNIGAKLAGDLHLDVFTGVGLRVGLRKHQVIDASEYPEGPKSHFWGMFSPAERTTIDSPSGWSSLHTVPFLSMGIRIGIGFKTVTAPPQ